MGFVLYSESWSKTAKKLKQKTKQQGSANKQTLADQPTKIGRGRGFLSLSRNKVRLFRTGGRTEREGGAGSSPASGSSLYSATTELEVGVGAGPCGPRTPEPGHKGREEPQGGRGGREAEVPLRAAL